jgi:hypothetical protein
MYRPMEEKSFNQKRMRILRLSIIWRRKLFLNRTFANYSGRVAIAKGSLFRYSYKYIEHSIRKHRLVNIEDHAVGPSARSPRPVSSSQPTRQTRTAFSEADDLFLLKRVDIYERQGMKALGNELYKIIEEEVWNSLDHTNLPS